MIKKKLIAGNWKMNCLTFEAKALAKSIAAKVKEGDFCCDFFFKPNYPILVHQLLLVKILIIEK